MSADRLALGILGGVVAIFTLSRRREKPDEELPWQARRYLKGAWGRYKRMLAAAEVTSEKVDDWEAIRRDGKEAAAEINEIRRRYGQDPIDFEGIERLEEIEGMGGSVHPEDIGHEFAWKPYDPTEEF